MIRNTGSVDIHDEYVVIDAQALGKCGYPRSIYGHRCTGVKEVWLSMVVIWSLMHMSTLCEDIHDEYVVMDA